jgi:hypothetical protein
MSSIVHSTHTHRRFLLGRVSLIFGNLAVWAMLISAAVAITRGL